MYALTAKAETKRIGEILFFCGVLVTLMVLGQEWRRLFP